MSTETEKIQLPDVDTSYECLNCSGRGMIPFYEQADVPAHSCLLMNSPEEAQNYPKGDLKLGFCPSCGFISNLLFDIELNEYSSRYEETQHFSPRFNEFARSLARNVVQKYGLDKKNTLEIGCGKGEFLVMMCEEGARGGIGIDPGYIEERLSGEAASKIQFIKDLYSEKYSHLSADFVLCRHTLEHIHTTRKFMEMIRRSIGDRKDSVVFFELPDIYRVLKECAFWDLYYEHCTYFSLGSLARLFRLCHFEVTDLYADYDDQYLLIAATPTDGPTEPRLEAEDDLEELKRAVSDFVEEFPRRLAGWKKQLDDAVGEGKRVVVWGSGSKAVAYLTTLGVYDEVEYVVDINPHKHGKFLPGTGQKIVSPEFLKDYRPDEVIIMNPIYVEEIRKNLKELGLEPALSACQ